MTEEEKWQYLVELDGRLLQGAAILSEWATFLTRDADLAFVGGAHLASVVIGLAAVETHLRGEGGGTKQRLRDLIAGADLEEDLQEELQLLRKYRNKWVHVDDPWHDHALLESPHQHEAELESMALRCGVLYVEPSTRTPGYEAFLGRSGTRWGSVCLAAVWPNHLAEEGEAPIS